jgi:hypothetical protein
MDCGNGRPLCARPERDYVVVFVAHGTSKKRVGTGTGGCYGSSGPVAIQWHAAKDKGAADDAKRRSILRGRCRLALCCAITLWEIWAGLQRDSRVCSSDNFGLGTR